MNEFAKEYQIALSSIDLFIWEKYNKKQNYEVFWGRSHIAEMSGLINLLVFEYLWG